MVPSGWAVFADWGCFAFNAEARATRRDGERGTGFQPVAVGWAQVARWGDCGRRFCASALTAHQHSRPDRL